MFSLRSAEYLRHDFAFSALLLVHEERVEHDDALREHRNLELIVVLELVEKLTEREVALNLEATPQREFGVVILKSSSDDKLTGRL